MERCREVPLVLLELVSDVFIGVVEGLELFLRLQVGESSF
jgi:hypothetical protein